MATPPSFTSGATLTANQLNKVGCWLVKTQAIGSGVASVTVSEAFSGDYDYYLIYVQADSVAAGGPYMSLQLGSTTTGYYWGAATVVYSTGGTSNIAVNNGASFNRLGPATTTGLNTFVNVVSPWKSENTTISAPYADPSVGGSGGFGSGFLNNTVSYTSFTIGLTSSTMTGGSIRVYGFR